jgi:Tfp pilus assembly ATPase PilU
VKVITPSFFASQYCHYRRESAILTLLEFAQDHKIFILYAKNNLAISIKCKILVEAISSKKIETKNIKMKIVAGIIAAASASQELFQAWKEEHEVEYASQVEEVSRYGVWMKNKVTKLF